MSKRVSRAAVLTAFAALALAAPATAGEPARGPYTAADWTRLAQVPEIYGVWETLGGPVNANGSPMNAEAAAKLAKYRAAQQAGQIQDLESANCTPPSIPINMAMPYPIELVVSPGKVTMIMEAFTQVRHIYTDGRALPEEPDLTYNGTSIGRWEGDSLIVETIGFLPETELAYGLGHTDKLKIVERIRLADPNKLEVQFTITDPGVFTGPWTITRNYQRRRTWGLREYVCDQNNRHTFEEDGSATINLGN